MKKFLLGLLCLVTMLMLSEVDALTLNTGTYTSKDGHKIVINSDNTVKYDDTYALTLNSKVKGSTLTGKLGTDNKSTTFYQINETKIISGAVMTYKHDDVTTYLYDYTVFSTDNTPVVDDAGKIELWRNDSKVNSYSNLQHAVDAAQSGDIIKITDDISVEGGAYISDKNITIDGLNHTLKSSSWLNTIFVVSESATLNIKNLTVDGDATGFEVDKSSINIQTGTSTKIPIKSGSDSSDPKRNLSVIVSLGNLNIVNSGFNNHYGVNGAVINVVSGNLNLDSSEFKHNRATTGGSLYIGSNFKATQTNYSINDVIIKDCEFSENYSGNGGAIYMYNVEKTDILSTDFIKNNVTGGKGGAILISNQSKRVSTNFNIPFPSMFLDNVLFEGNWVGNDGAAIENHEAAMVIKNSIFRKNVGIHSTSSCGTVSFLVSEVKQVPQVIENCLFEENMGGASTLADHGTYVKLDVINTKFVRNKAGYNSLLLYSANALFDNCLFEDEIVSKAIIDIISFGPEYYDNIPRKVILRDVTFKNTKYNANEVWVRTLNDENDFNSIVVIEGNTTANIDVWKGNEVIVKGTLNGSIDTDGITPKENIVIEKTGKVNGDVNLNKNKKTITLIFKDNEEIEEYFWETTKFIYTDKESLTQQEFFLEHQVEKENYMLVYYTDSGFQNKWDYTVNDNITIYGRWEQHTHIYEDTYVAYKNSIYEQCECGHLGKKLSISVKENNIYNGKKVEATINNELGIDSSKYNLSYYEEKNEKWEKINEAPVNDGKYKVVLTLNDASIEQIFNIVPSNPNTGDNIGIYIGMFIICLVVIFNLAFFFKKNIIIKI